MSSPQPTPHVRRAPAIQRWFLRGMVGLYRRTGGRFGGRIGPTPVLLLTTVGRRSGQAHTVPLGYFEREGTRFVVASNAGQPQDPSWYANLVTHPEVEVEIGHQRYRATASPTTGEERQRLWDFLMEVAPSYRRYARAPREIPLVILRPVA